MQVCNAFWAWLSEIQNAQWLEWFKVLVDLGKSWGWPAAVLLLVWWFRDEIKKLIPNIKKAGPSGLEFDKFNQAPTSPPTAELEQQAIPVGGNDERRPYIEQHPLRTVNMLAISLREELDRFVAEEREPVLIRALAEARVLADFELIFANIFGSQVDALEVLETAPRSLEFAEEYFEHHIVPRNPDFFTTIGFEKWARFLQTTELVHVMGNTVELTAKGVDFLDFRRTRKAGFGLSN